MSRRRVAPPNPKPDRALRADARRNRDRVLAVARKLFESEGIAVEMDEIARQAGVGVGTIYRHFPTKEALIRGVADVFAERLLEAARERSDADDPGAAFFEYLSILATELAAKRSLGHAMADAELTPTRVAERRALFHDAFDALLARAQQARAVRPDVTVADVLVLVRAPIASGHHDAATRRRLLEIVCDGLRLRRR